VNSTSDLIGFLAAAAAMVALTLLCWAVLAPVAVVVGVWRAA
jgi:E3 ubiquitin-protein ligase DOA10